MSARGHFIPDTLPVGAARARPLLRRKTPSTSTSRLGMSSAVPSSEPASGPMSRVTQGEAAAAVFRDIKDCHRRRQDFLNAEGALTRQIKAIERRMKAWDTMSPCAAVSSSAPVNGGAGHRSAAIQRHYAGASSLVTLQLHVARKPLRAHRREAEKEMVALAKTLPVYTSFVEPIFGMGALGLAQIVGEAGNLSGYSGPAKLWKRFGLGLVGGERQGRRTNAKEAAEHGYSPRRRSVIYIIGDSLLKKRNAYKGLYDERKKYEVAKAKAAGLKVRAARKGDPRDQASAGFRSKLVIHRRAQRYVEKRLLRNLWRTWRDQMPSDIPRADVSPRPQAEVLDPRRILRGTVKVGGMNGIPPEQTESTA